MQVLRTRGAEEDQVYETEPISGRDGRPGGSAAVRALATVSQQLEARDKEVASLTKELEKQREEVAAAGRLDASRREELAMLAATSQQLESMRLEQEVAAQQLEARGCEVIKLSEGIELAEARSSATMERAAARLHHLMGRERLLASVLHSWRLASTASAEERRRAETEASHNVERALAAKELQEAMAHAASARGEAESQLAEALRTRSSVPAASRGS